MTRINGAKKNVARSMFEQKVLDNLKTPVNLGLFGSVLQQAMDDMNQLSRTHGQFVVEAIEHDPNAQIPGLANEDLERMLADLMMRRLNRSPGIDQLTAALVTLRATCVMSLVRSVKEHTILHKHMGYDPINNTMDLQYPFVVACTEVPVYVDMITDNGKPRSYFKPGEVAEKCDRVMGVAAEVKGETDGAAET